MSGNEAESSGERTSHEEASLNSRVHRDIRGRDSRKHISCCSKSQATRTQSPPEQRRTLQLSSQCG